MAIEGLDMHRHDLGERRASDIEVRALLGALRRPRDPPVGLTSALSNARHLAPWPPLSGAR